MPPKKSAAEKRSEKAASLAVQLEYYKRLDEEERVKREAQMAAINKTLTYADSERNMELDRIMRSFDTLKLKIDECFATRPAGESLRHSNNIVFSGAAVVEYFKRLKAAIELDLESISTSLAAAEQVQIAHSVNDELDPDFQK